MKKITLLIFVSLLSFCGYAQLPNESFEDPWVATPGSENAPPGGWLVLKQNPPLNETWNRKLSDPVASRPSNTGDYFAYLEKETVCQTCVPPKNWLITKAFPNPANGQGQLKFWSRLTLPQENNGIYKVKIFTEGPGKDPLNFDDWTDLVPPMNDFQLNPLQLTWTEKIINMPNFTGNVRIAFVMEASNKDRWMIDDVSVTSPCPTPTNVSVPSKTMTTATIQWTNPGGVAQWEIQVATGNPVSENWITYNGTTTSYVYGLLPGEVLTPDTEYRVFLRSVCADTGKSTTTNFVAFSTAALGDTCTDPLVIPSPLPYTTTNDTGNFANNYLGAPGTGCNATGSYLQGNDVVYKYTPNISGNIRVSVAGNNANTGMFIYSDCANIGTNCIAGITVGGTAGPLVIPSLAVTANTPIYIVISSNASVATTPYTLSLQQIFCDAPTAAAVTATSFDSATLTWAGTSSEYQVAVRPAGTAGFPTTGLTVTTNTTSVNATTEPVAGPLTSSTNYEYYVRAKCTDGINYSIWVGPIAFTTTQIPATLNFTDDFETLPSKWTLLNSNQTNKWVINQNATAGNTGSGGTGNSLFVSNDNGINNLYTITSQSIVHAYRDVTIPAGATTLNLSFDWKSVAQSGTDVVRVYLVPTTYAIAAGNRILTTGAGNTDNIKIGADLSNSAVWSTSNTVINLPASVPNSTRRLVFEWYNNANTGTQPPAAIDNVNLSRVTCPAPGVATITGTSLQATSVDLGWTLPTSAPANGYEIYAGPSTTQPGANPVAVPGTTVVTTSPTNSVSLNGANALTPSQSYYVWVRANCGPTDKSTWSGPLFFVAPQVPAGMDYSQNFDGATHEWGLANGTMANKWAVGTAVNNSGTKSLYISSDNGITNSYNNASASIVHAYRDIHMPPTLDQLELSFDWKGVGEASDYLTVWLIDTDYTPSANNTIPNAAGRILIPVQFTGSTTWTNYKYIIQGSTYANQNKRLVFTWTNNAANGSNPPAAVDNIILKVVQCPQPSNPVIASMTAAQTNFSWTAPTNGATAYQYYYSTDPAMPTTATPANQLHATTTATGSATDLLPSSTYYYWVRTDCGTSQSYWVGPVKFITPQIPATMDYAENFDGATHGYQLINDNQTNKWFVGSATSNSASNSLYITNNNGANNAYSNTASVVHAYRDIQLPVVAQDVQLTFDWKGTGAAGDYFKVWMVPIDFVPTPGQQIGGLPGSRIQVGTTSYYNNAGWKTENLIFNVNAFQNTARRLVFEWTNDAFTDFQRPAAIDNVRLTSVTCYPPTNLTMPSNNAGGATFAWTAPATGTPTSYEYYYDSSLAAPTATTQIKGSVPSTSVTLAGLPPSSNYNFWVRSSCGTNSKSAWIGPLELNTAQQASSLPYFQNFDGIVHDWTLKNGTQQNKWTVGTAVSNSPNKSLYISDTNGETNNYNLSAASTVHAYKDFFIPPGATTLDLSFVWKSAGDGFNDYLRVWRVATNFVPTGTMSTANGQLITTTYLRNSTNWTSASYTLDATGYQNSNQRIVFEWVNDAFTGPQAPAAVDNIDLQVITCPKPTGLGVSGVTASGATFNWNEAGTAQKWEVYVSPIDQAAPTAATLGTEVTSTDPNPHSYTYTTPELQPSTNYGFYVRAICSASDKSKWSGPFAFSTLIANDECSGAYTLGVNEINNSCVQFARTSYTGATPSTVPFPCGIVVNGADIWYEFVATGDRHNVELSDFSSVGKYRPTWDTTKDYDIAGNPVVISLYQGDDCGTLQPLSCSYVNVLQAINLIPGTTYKVRLTLTGPAPYYLNTSYKVCVNTPNPIDFGGTACSVTTINPSFEQPRDPNYPNPAGDIRVHQNVVQGWRTTATDGRIEFWPNGNEGHMAYDGHMFVELNANEIAGLYQDFSTPNSTTFTYSFAHKGRNCVDKLELRAGDPNSPTLTLVTTAETGFAPNGWVVYTGTYTSPPGQTTTRFLFLSASSCNGNATIGNFLDDIRFTADNSIVNYGPQNLTCVDNVLTAEAAGSGEWSPAPSNPSETVVTDPTNPNTTITGFSRTGTYTYYWTTLYCRSEFSVNYNNGDVPAPAATAQVDYCLNATPVALTATALTGHTLNWYTTQTGGTASATAPTPTASTLGSTTYYVSQTAPDSCESPRTAITVTVHAIPTAPIAAVTYNYCQDATAIQLTATVFTNHTLNWYTVPTDGTASTTAPTPDTSVPGTTIYYVSQTSQFGCESNRTAITINVAPAIIPVTAFTLPASVCIEDPNPTAVPGTDFTTGGYFTGAGGLIINPTTGEIDLTQSTPGTYTVKYTVDPDPTTCNKGSSTSVQIVVTPLATAVTGFSYTTPACAGTPNQLPSLAADFSTGGVFSSTTGLVIDAATGEINLATSTTGTYTVTYTFTGNIADCTADGSGTAEIVIVPVFEPVIEFGYDTSYCYDVPTATPALDANFTTGGTFSGTAGLAIDPVTGEINITASTPGEHTVTYTFNADNVNCINGGSKSDTFTIGTALPFVFDGECNGTSFILTASPDENSSFEGNGSLSYQWTTATGSPIGTNAYNLNVTEYANSIAGDNKFPMTLKLTITDANGCETTREHIVPGIGCSIQKGISPNSDGLNDYFDLEYMGVKKLSIFNRYGQEVYTKANYTKEWIGQGKNGDELPTGVYYYVIERSAGGTDTGWIYINRED